MEDEARAERAAVRSTVFGHMAGIVLAPTVKALWDRGVLQQLRDSRGWLRLREIVEHNSANAGYLRVALRLLSSCGWLEQRIEDDGSSVSYRLTGEGELAVRLAPPLYGEVVPFIPQAMFLEDYLSGDTEGGAPPLLCALVERARHGWGIGPSEDPREASLGRLLRRHLDGMLVGPAMVALARNGVLRRLEAASVAPDGIGADTAGLGCIFELLEAIGWAQRAARGVELTAPGRDAARIASAYGVTVSYLPLFNVLPALLFGNARLPRADESGIELLVNRAMNVWGSGGAHGTYFRKVDEIIVEIFDRPLERQPQGICDMGCGDGALLEHLYEVVRRRTARGRSLDSHPLVLVGADFNKVARRVAKQRLRRSGIPSFHIIPGDINRPARLAGDLEQLDLDVHDLLHVRSFLDHNRPYSPPVGYTPGTRSSRSSGAFARLGDEIPPDALEENLARHLRRWAPYVRRYGLLVLELHTLAPELVAANLDRTPAVAYDGTHGFSDQYLVELPIFLDCAREAGLRADERYQCRFPPSELATVSLSFFEALEAGSA
jgi:hypothetical protein